MIHVPIDWIKGLYTGKSGVKIGMDGGRCNKTDYFDSLVMVLNETFKEIFYTSLSV